MWFGKPKRSAAAALAGASLIAPTHAIAAQNARPAEPDAERQWLSQRIAAHRQTSMLDECAEVYAVERRLGASDRQALDAAFNHFRRSLHLRVRHERDLKLACRVFDEGWGG